MCLVEVKTNEKTDPTKKIKVNRGNALNQSQNETKK